jgi:hypothetical protein
MATWDFLGPAIASPDTTADSPRYADTEADGGSDDEESDDDLSPQSLFVGHVSEEGTATLAFVRLPLVQDGLPRGPHCALLDAAIDRVLGGLLCGGDGEGHAALKVVFVDGDAEVCLGLGRRVVEGVTCLAEGLRVLVKGRVGVGGVGGPFLLGEVSVGRGRRHGGVVGGRRAQRLRGRWAC